MENQIKILEDLSLNAWPSHQMQIYDGWILRFSYFYTHRTNCVEQIGPSVIPLADKLDYCEETYHRWGTPAIFKINPLTAPSFDELLAKRGYETAHITEVMLKKLTYTSPKRTPYPIVLNSCVSSKWLDALFRMKATINPIHRRIVPSMYAAIPKDVIAASVYDENEIIGTGLAILDRDYAGIYAIHVHKDYRGQGIGRSICESLLNASAKCGASFAYLQVVQGNKPAKALYKSLGFQDFYTYWFRQQYI